MKSRCLIFFIPLIILQMIILALPLYAAEEDLFKENKEKGIAFMSGGVSQTEREILKERGKEYTLKLIFSSKRGEYLSNVIVKVLDQKNRTVLLTVSNGPWLFIDLPSGIYEIEASLRADQKKVSQIKIERGKQKVFHLRWQLKDEFRKELKKGSPFTQSLGMWDRPVFQLASISISDYQRTASSSILKKRPFLLTNPSARWIGRHSIKERTKRYLG